MTHTIETSLKDFTDLLEKLGAGVEPAAVHAINDTAQWGRTLGSREIRRRINFKSRYVDERLQVTKRASESTLEAVITGRDRPTSLARFAQGGVRFGRPRVAPRVRVKASGAAKPMSNAFFMRLRRGSAAVTAENSNVGLAIRLREGERVHNKNMTPLSGGIALLYGPSVGQVFRTVSENTVDQIGEHLAERFARQLERML